jgi:hypothetical protein
MAENERVVLGDKDVYPSEDIIYSIIGDKKIIWQKIMNYLTDNYENTAGEWRFYNDGKQWLFKMQQKKKTLFWISLLKNSFRITFYFGNKAEPLIMNSILAEKIKADFTSSKRFGSIRAITTIISDPSDLENIYTLIDLKAGIK